MLDPFFNPCGVAVIGASADPVKLGHGVVRNLVKCGYQGRIYPINPRADEILGLTCYPSINEAPDPVDLAVIVVPAAAVPGVVDACGRRGIGHAIVVSGGFGETGREGKALEEALLATAARHQMRIIGPNCVGTIDSHTPVNTTFLVGMPQQGDICFISQSGAMCAVVIDWAQRAGVGFSRIASLGNQVDVNEAELLSAVAADQHTRVITAYIEGVSDGRAFMAAASNAARRRPLVVLKGGLGKGGAQAVASHTGALAGRAEAYEAAFKQCGVLRADTMEELFDWASALARQPLPLGKRVAVLTNAGGPGVLAVDALERAGMEMAPLSSATRAYLAEHLPAVSSNSNPVDILAGSGPGHYALALEALLVDPTVDAALVIQAPQDWFVPAELAEVVAKIAARQDKPVLASLMGLEVDDAALAILGQHGVPNYAFPERAAGVLAAMVARRQWLETPQEAPADLVGIDRVAARIGLAGGDFAAALEAYGISHPPGGRAISAPEAVDLAERIGYPVVLKIDSPAVSHKSDIGGVMLNLADGPAVGAAYAQVVAAADNAKAGSRVLVQKMMAGGQELIVGVRRDPQFGALALVGGGGVEVELRRDVALGIAPLGQGQAGRMLDETMAGVLLRGWRGSPAGDRAAVLSALCRVAQIGYDFPEIAELEVNPLYVLPQGGGVYALDVRGVLEQ